MHGIDPKLDFSNLNSIIDVYERCTGMTVPARQPYAGELVFTAFSGSHQDAIKKGLAGMGKARPRGQHWDVPYLTIDPADIGREYREVIRVNSQSGKGGVAYLLESEFGIELPKEMQREFGPIANEEVDRLGREVQRRGIEGDVLEGIHRAQAAPWWLGKFAPTAKTAMLIARRTLFRNEFQFVDQWKWKWPFGCVGQWLRIYWQHPSNGVPRFEITNYSEHALSSGEAATAIAYIQIKTAEGKSRWGAGVDDNIELASVRAILSALNRL